jgi:hypothetical protein
MTQTTPAWLTVGWIVALIVLVLSIVFAAINKLELVPAALLASAAVDAAGRIVLGWLAERARLAGEPRFGSFRADWYQRMVPIGADFRSTYQRSPTPD